MSAAVVGLHGPVNEQPGEPVADVVAILKRWLAKAEAGEVIGVAMAGVAEDTTGEMHRVTGFSLRGGKNQAYQCLDASISALRHRWDVYLFDSMGVQEKASPSDDGAA